MAYLLETLRNQGAKAAHGRNLKLDNGHFLVGPKDIRRQIEDLTTTAASSLSPYGLSRLMASGSSQCSEYTLQAPVIGVEKRIVMHSSSTGCQLVRASGGALFYGCSVSTVGSTVINFVKGGADVTLEAMSATAWRLVNSFSSLVSSDNRGFTFTTST